jgi:fibronectin-binding autotransporter adhesin
MLTKSRSASEASSAVGACRFLSFSMGKAFLPITLLAATLTPASAANSVANVANNKTDLTAAASYSTATLPSTTTDVVFTAAGIYSTPAFTLNASESFGTIDDLSATTLTIDNKSGTADILTLNPGSNATSGSASTDFIFVKSGSTLSIGTASTTALSLSLTNTGSIDSAGTLNIGSGITIATNKTLTFTGAGSTTLSGVIANTNGAVTVNDAGGSVTLSGVGNAYSGATTVTSGTLNLSGSITASNVTVNGGALSESSTGIISGAKTFTLNGGSASFAGANTYTGNTTIDGGSTLTLTGSIASGSNLVLGNATLGGGKLTYSKTSATETFAGTTLNAGASAVGSTILTGTVALSSITRNSGSTVDFTTTGPISTKTANTGGILGGYATFGGSTWAVGATNGGTATTITGLATGSYTASFTSGANVDAATGASTAASGLSINSLRFNNSGNYTVGVTDTLTIATGGILETTAVGAHAVSINSGTLTSGNGSDLIVIQNNTSGALTIGSQISGSIGLTKSGTGTLIISGANNYNGATIVNAGTLQLGAANAVTSGSALTTFAGATFDLNGKNETLGALVNEGTVTNSNATPATVTFGAATASSGTGTFTGALNVEISNGATASTLATTFDNAGTITNDGSGVGLVTLSGLIDTNVTGITQNSSTSALTLTGANTFNGPITITTGTLSIGTGGGTASLGSLTYTGNISDNGTFVFNSSASQTINGVISGSGGITKSQGTLILGGQNTYTGTTFLNGGTSLQLNSAENPGVSGPLGNGGLIQWGIVGGTGSTFLSYSAANQFDYSSRFSTAQQSIQINTAGQTVTFATTLMAGTAGTLTLQDFNSATGKLILGTSETYTGLTAVNKGILQLGAGATLNSGNALTTGNAGTFDLNGNNQTLGVLTNVSGGVVTNSNATASTLTIGDGSTGVAGSAVTGNLNVVWHAATASPTIASTFSNTGNLTFDEDGTGSITLSGTNGSLNNVGTITNAGAGTGTTTISTVIGSNVTGVTQNSAGSVLVLKGANAYTGSTTISAGTLQASNANALGNVGNSLAINGGGVLDIENFAQTVGSTTLGLTGSSLGSTIQSTGGTKVLTTSGVTVDGTNNTIASSVGVSGAITQDANSGLTINGAAFTDDLATGATLNGTGNLNAVTLAGNNTLSSAGTLTTTGITVSGTGNSISTGTVSGDVNLTGTSSLAVNGTAAGAATVGDGTGVATLSGNGTIAGGVTTADQSGSNVAHIAPGATPGTAGTLHVGSAGMALGNGTNLDFDLASTAAGTSDLISMAGGTLTIGGTLTFNINELSSPTLGTTGNYVLIDGFTNSDALTANGTIVSTSGASGYTPTYSVISDGSGAEELVVSFAAAGGSTSYFYTGTTGTSFNDFANYNTTAAGGVQQTAPLSATSDVTIGSTTPTPSNLTPVLNSSVAINSLTIAASGAALSSSGSNTLTLLSSGTGLADTATGGTTETVSAAVALGASQTWSVSSSTNSLTVSGQVSDGGSGFALTKTGAGTLALTNAAGNMYSGGTTVTAGTLLVSNTSGSATGTGTLAVGTNATLAGLGRISATSFNIAGTGTTTGMLASILVGHTSASDTNTTGSLTLLGSSASTITDANLTFNLSATTPGQSNSLVVGGTNITFSGTQLTLNMVGQAIVAAYTPYVLIDGLSSSQYAGLSTFMNSLGQEQITAGLSLVFNDGVSQSYYQPSYLFVTSGGDIDVEVVPEPSTWALMFGGLAALIFWQRRNNRKT